MLRANSRLRRTLGPAATDLLTHIAGAFERILPHVELPEWTEAAWREPGSFWNGNTRKEIRITIGIGKQDDPSSRSLTCLIRRRQASGARVVSETLDTREYDICKRIALRITEVITSIVTSGALDQITLASTINAIRGSFDESVIAEHIESHHGLKMAVSSVLGALHTLSEQTYENKALVFGCILDSSKTSENGTQFPEPFLGAKKYKALSDGFKTAYHVSKAGTVVDFVELQRVNTPNLTERHFYPDWTEPMARVSRQGKCGITLTRQGDLLVFDEGTLRFTYRYGRWRYWNHSHVVNLLRDRARAQRVPPKILGTVVGSIYRAALDVSFRRSGGLFVILHNQNQIRDIVREGDAIGDRKRARSDREFDRVVEAHKMQTLHRAVAVDLASLDGAIVLANSRKILAYGAILQPKKVGHLPGSEGSRTKAAIGASKYGLAVKISSDGDITVYFAGKEFFRM